MDTDNHDQLTFSALALPTAQRADLANVLLASLEMPGDVIDAEEFGNALRKRVADHRAGRVTSLDLEDARAAIEQRVRRGSGE